MSVLAFSEPFFKTVFEEAFPLARASSAEWQAPNAGMTMDLRETPQAYVVHVDVPGIKKENINVDFEKNVLTISAEFKKEEKVEGEKIHWEERRTGHMSRSIRLPDNVNVKDIKANHDNGVLTVTIPKVVKASEIPRRISIN